MTKKRTNKDVQGEPGQAAREEQVEDLGRRTFAALLHLGELYETTRLLEGKLSQLALESEETADAIREVESQIRFAIGAGNPLHRDNVKRDAQRK